MDTNTEQNPERTSGDAHVGNDEGAQLSRKERERLARRQLIVDAARRTFAYKGFNNARLEEIAELAEFSKASLYSYFETKEALFEQVLEDAFLEVKAVTEQAFSGDDAFEIKLERFIEHMLRYFFLNFENYHLIRNESHNLNASNPILHRIPELLDIIVEAISRAQAKNIVRKIDPFDTAILMFDVMFTQVGGRIYKHLIKTDIEMVMGNRESRENFLRTLSGEEAEYESAVAASTKLIMTVLTKGILAK